MAGNATLNTFVTFPFGQGSAAGDRYALEESKRAPIVPGLNSIGPLAKYFCVFPSATNLKLITTLGSINANSAGLTKAAEDTVSFGASSVLAELRYPAATVVTYTIIGNLLAADGVPPVTVTFDATKNAMVASKPCYGSLRVKYKAPYDLWLAVFDIPKTPLKSPPQPHQVGLGGGNPDDDVPNTSTDVIMTILAYRAHPTAEQDPEEVVASLTLASPSVGDTTDPPTAPPGGGGGAFADSGAALPKIRFEIDPTYPPRLLPPAKGASKPVAGVRVWVVPAAQPQMDLTSGQIVGWATGGGGPISEMLTFNNSMSQSLRYQPAGSLSFGAIGVFVDKWGHTFTPYLVGPGGKVTVVEWLDEHTFKNPTTRTVLVDEVVVCDLFGNAIPSYGVVKATYSFT